MKRHLGSWQGLNEQQKESFSFLCSFLSGERKSEVLFCTFVASADLPKEDVLHYVWSSPLYALTFPDAFGTVNLWDFSFCILIRWVCGRYLKKNSFQLVLALPCSELMSGFFSKYFATLASHLYPPRCSFSMVRQAKASSV